MTSTALSPESRRRALERAADGVVDLLVVGGGITGAGVAREAALRGLACIVVDKGDFACGTSSRSSKLIHGGVRYLAQGDVALVREAARERAVLRRLAPHLAIPTRMLVPVASRAGRLKMSAGLWSFERLAGDLGDEEPYTSMDAAQALEAEPGLRSDHVAGAVAFTEYRTDDARLVLETVRSAVDDGAQALTRAEVRAVEATDGGWTVTLDDLESGASLDVRARCLVNASGPWFDRVRRMTEPDGEAKLQLTRGIHLVVRSEDLPVRNSVVLRSPDGRSTFVVPAGPVSYIGTTDTYYDGDPQEPGVSSDDVAYLLESVAATFGDAPDASRIVGTWSGVRPLLGEPGKKPSEISRRDEILTGPGPIVAVAGGKLTTYRRMAERVIEKVGEVLGRGDLREGLSAERPLAAGGAEDQARSRAESTPLSDPELDARIWSTYGAHAAEVVERLGREGGAETMGGVAELTRAEVEYHVECEGALGVEDVLRRRSRLAMYNGEAALAAAPDVAAVLAERLGWDADRKAAELEGFTELVGSELGDARRPESRRRTAV